MKPPGELEPSEWGLILLIFVLIVLASWLGLGCATMKQTCHFVGDPPVLTEVVTRASVIGTGDIAVQTQETCGKLRYTTHDTGMSDNARMAVEKAAEGAARGAVSALVP